MTDAAIKGKVDPLIGLKENVLIGKLIPAGTGMRRYRATRLNTDINPDMDVMLDESDDEVTMDEEFVEYAEVNAEEMSSEEEPVIGVIEE